MGVAETSPIGVPDDPDGNEIAGMTIRERNERINYKHAESTMRRDGASVAA